MHAAFVHHHVTRGFTFTRACILSARVCVAGLFALHTGCSGRGPAPSTADPDPDRARAALATLHVDNQTPHELDVSYRIAGRSAARVVIGRAAPDSRAEMAPVPAGEPLILVARTSGGAELTLPPRTFAIDGAWTWRIARNARFVPPDQRPR
jgi:hypothetical protein